MHTISGPNVSPARHTYVPGEAVRLLSHADTGTLHVIWLEQLAVHSYLSTSTICSLHKVCKATCNHIIVKAISKWLSHRESLGHDCCHKHTQIPRPFWQARWCQAALYVLVTMLHLTSLLVCHIQHDMHACVNTGGQTLGFPAALFLFDG